MILRFTKPDGHQFGERILFQLSCFLWEPYLTKLLDALQLDFGWNISFDIQSLCNKLPHLSERLVTNSSPLYDPTRQAMLGTLRTSPFRNQLTQYELLGQLPSSAICTFKQYQTRLHEVGKQLTILVSLPFIAVLTDHLDFKSPSQGQNLLTALTHETFSHKRIGRDMITSFNCGPLGQDIKSHGHMQRTFQSLTAKVLSNRFKSTSQSESYGIFSWVHLLRLLCHMVQTQVLPSRTLLFFLL